MYVLQKTDTFYHGELTSVNTNGLGDNTKDHYERISVANASGAYTITVTHRDPCGPVVKLLTHCNRRCRTGSIAVASVPTGVNVTGAKRAKC
jgi:hypothetical protein